MKTFSIGQQLSTSSICDSNCIFKAEVIKRTAKTVTIKVRGELVRRKIQIFDGAESIFPFGQYSMAPIFRAA